MSRAPVIILALLFATLATALSLTGPTWSPATPYTNNTLTCSWTNSSDTIAQNITLLLNGTYFNSSYENASVENLRSSMTVPASDTTRGDIWTCRITLYNGTASTMQDVNVTILNSPPGTEGAGAGIFNSSNTDVGYLVQIREDTSMVIDVNATDADGDVLTYLPGDGYCTRTSSSLGTYTCSVTQSNIVNNLPTLSNITFTVSDGQNVGGRTIVFNATPVNDAPAATLTNQTTPVNLSLNYTFSVTDEENSFPFSFVISAPGEIADKITISRLNTNGTSASIYYNAAAPDFNDVGLWGINVTITDNSTLSNGTNDSASINLSFNLNITAVGRRPHFKSITPNGTYTVAQGQFMQINITANDSDANTFMTFLVGTSRFNISTVTAWTNTSDARAQINFTPTNSDVGVYNVTLTIMDEQSLTNTTPLQFNVTNVNDAPALNQISLSASNTLSNSNASNLTAYANALFIYDVNGSDIDTQYGDVLTYADNTSLFSINATSGRISFTPSALQVGNYHINITVTDTEGLLANRTLNLTINSNNPPYFNATLQQLNCTTKAICSLILGGYTADPDVGDAVSSYNITFVGSNISNFTYNTTSGSISFLTAKTDVGNYTVNITIGDSFGSQNSSVMNISINNTPEAPNLSRYNFSGETIVETHLFTYELQATDEDFNLGSINEAVNFTTTSSISHTISPLATTNTTARALLSFTPSLGQNGTYTIHINATDSFGLVGSRNITFVILPKVPAPNITTVTPWGNGSNFTIQTSYANTTDAAFSNNNANVVLSENTTVLFNITVNSTRPLNYSWMVNGTQVSTAVNYTRLFNSFSSGYYLVSVNVSDDRLESTTWNWSVTVTNVNRAPVLVSSLQTPLTVNGTTTYSTYFTLSNGTKFLDPDDDLDSSGALNGNETNTLVFTATACNVASLSASGSDLRVEGSAIGSCNVTFNATDTGGLTLESNGVDINITDVDEGTTEVTTTVSSGGGGGSSSISTFVPLNKKLDNPKAFNLITPRLVTIYNNRSVIIPITINNTWNGPLKGLQLVAKSNETLIKASFDIDYFEEIPVNESRDVKLTLTNYRFGDNYEVLVIGNVTDPPYEDRALVLLNSIEQSGDGDDVKVKVTFANDLVNEHPECQELNEVLTQAKQKIAEGDTEEGTALVESVINGCKYLVSMQQKIQEKPSRINPVINIDDLSLRSIMLGVLAFVVLSSIAFLIYYHYTHKPEDDI